MGGGVSEATMFVYPPAQPVILQRRVFAAPRALVWESCTEARHMAAWWGPRGYVNEACEVDARPGGRWRVAMDRLEEILDALAPAGAGAKRELVLSRVVDAPCALVFEAWTSPEHVDRWMGPRGYTTETLSMDVRVGGAWRYTMTGPDGTVYPNRVTYRAIEPPARLEYRHDADTDEDPHGFDVWVSFAEEEEGRRTRVSMRMRLASKEARDFTIGFGAVELGYQTLARLAEHVGGGPARRSGLIHEGDEHGT
ncbi:MAG: SRPBCC family protein [Gemmatimonadota bacterium]